MTPRVLVTDHPGPTIDVERSTLAAIGADVVVAPATDAITLARYARDADAIITCFAQVTEAVLEAAPRCITVARTGVGVDNIDVDYATSAGIVVSNVRDYCTPEVADHALALLLSVARGFGPLMCDTRAGGWDRDLVPTPIGLTGKTVGILGFGAIGQAFAHRVAALGMTPMTVRRGAQLPPGVIGVDSTADLLAQVDVLSLHLPLTAQTAGIINAESLRSMKPGALLINTSRGGLVDTEALCDALESGHIAGAGLDVTEPEPLSPTHRLRARPDVVLTPHIAFSSDRSLADLSTKAATNVAAALRGRLPASVVNPEVIESPSSRLSVVTP